MTTQTQLLISRQLPAKTLYRIQHDWQYQSIRIEPSCPELDAVLQMATFVTTEDRRHGYRLTRRRQSLLNHPDVIANGGLAPIAQYVLMHLGHDVAVTRPPVRTWTKPADWVEPNPMVMDSHLAVFMRENSHGVVVHRLGVEKLLFLCVEIGHFSHGQRVAFIMPNRDIAERLHAYLSLQFTDVMLMVDGECNSDSSQVEDDLAAGECERSGSRIGVGIFGDLALPHVYGDPFDVLVYWDVAAAVGVNGQLALTAHGRARLFGFLREDRSLPPRISDLVMAAFGPAEVTVPRIGHQRRAVEVAWTRIAGGPAIRGEISGFQLYRQGIAQHRLRNRRIARLAKALVAGDGDRIRRICPAAWQATNNTPSRTMILVHDVDHGLALAELLAGWPLVTGADVELTGLSRRQRALLEGRHGLNRDGGRRAIVTISGITSVNLNTYDAVIWAGGGPGVPAVPKVQLVCWVQEHRRLLWIDCLDGHDNELQRASGLRRDAYSEVGWLPVGMAPVIGRMRRFLAARPRGES